MSRLPTLILLLLAALPALAQTPGTLNLSGPSTGGQTVTTATINAGVNAQLGSKADATNPVVAGNMTVGGNLAVAGTFGVTGAFTKAITFTGLGVGGLAINSPASFASLGFVGATANGGTVTWTTGSVQLGKSLILASGGQTGTVPTSGSIAAISIGVPADTVDAAGNNNGFQAVALSHNFGGTGFTGSHRAFQMNFTQTGTLGTANSFQDGLNINMAASLDGNGGNMIAFAPQINASAGATGWGLFEIMEAAVTSLAPTTGRVGIQLFPGAGFQGSGYDFAYGITGIPGGTGAPWLNMLQVGKPSQPFPLDTTNGCIMCAGAASTTMQIKSGIDISNITTTGNAWNDGHTKLTGAGEIVAAKITDPASAPGAASFKITVVAGTNAGSCKLIARAGTSATPVTIIDNVGSGC